MRSWETKSSPIIPVQVIDHKVAPSLSDNSKQITTSITIQKMTQPESHVMKYKKLYQDNANLDLNLTEKPNLIQFEISTHNKHDELNPVLQFETCSQSTKNLRPQPEKVFPGINKIKFKFR